MGSVKDLEVISKPTRDMMGIGRFNFSDRYSVFDWGGMPDQIDGKGSALCLMGAYCFEKLEEKGTATHYRGLVNNSGKLVSFDELDVPTNILEVDMVNVFKPKHIEKNGEFGYDYSFFNKDLRNYLIPLEVIYRNGLPEGSSVFKRLKEGSLTLEELNLDHYPMVGEHFSKPIFDVSTKLEETDRYLNWENAQKIAGITDDELKTIKITLSNVNEFINRMVADAGLKNEDGKIELAFDDKRQLIIVDVVGTLDECRFLYEDLHVSKEVARIFYRKTKWYQDVEEAKKTAKTKGITDWQSICKSNPPKLPPEFKEIISEIYMSTSNTLTKRKLFEVPNLPKVMSKYKDFINK